MFNMIGRYYPTTSDIHKMNPVAKFICLILFLILIFFINNMYLLFLFSFLTILIILLSNVPITHYLKVISSLKVLFVFIIIVNIIFNIPFYFSILSITKIVLGILYSVIIVFTTEFNDINYALNKLLSPLKILKIPVNQIVLSISLAINFIPIVFLQAEKIFKSQASRGIDFKYCNIKGKIIALSSILTPIFMLSFKRADEIADAMELRLYSCSYTRTSYKVYGWRFFDILLLMIHSVLFILLIWRGR